MAVLNRPELLLGFADYADQASALAERLKCPFALVETHRFPDGEHLVRLPPELPARIAICRSLHLPNDKLIELMLTARTARSLGARDISLVAPYLCYMRQDRAFRPGEAVSQRIVGEWLAGLFDGLLTVDPHLHRVAHLSEAVPAKRTVTLHATRPIGRWILERVADPVLVGPDEESGQWVRAIAEPHDLPWRVARKTRLGDREVRIELPDTGISGRHAVLVDDVASTGRTLEVAARALLEAGATGVDAVVTHALFVDDALERLRAAGIERITSTDSIPHPTNDIPLAGLLAEGIADAS